MATFLLILFVTTHLMLLHSAEEIKYELRCPPFNCGKLGKLTFPFSNTTSTECGAGITVKCEEPAEIQLGKRGHWYQIENISQADTVYVNDSLLLNKLQSRSCEYFDLLTLPHLPYVSFQIIPNLTLYKCNPPLSIPPPNYFNSTSCSDYHVYYNLSNALLPSIPRQCSVIQLPVDMVHSNGDLFSVLTAKFSLEVHVTSACNRCYYRRGGQCRSNSEGKFQCFDATGKQNFLLKLKLGIGIGGSAIIILIFSIYFIQRHYKIKYSSPEFLSKNTLSNPSSKSDLVGGTIYFGVPIFSHRELAEATNNFDSEKELGDGGYGIVYYGKLRDGREVAVKSLFENNYRRVEQFLNEIEILTRLQHKNLVTLYGCTSRRSRDLLLVYEYIPNGTVADHLHGERVKPSSLTWPIRMNIAIETASALAYLHASDIIHRDVKTNNILLDNNFSVKVADFGLSRLFPNDVTHISTVPQGTPGYVDPEYQQCYQLTDRSDVYSFGVVLIELISSMPAVDIARHRHEINLSNFAINKIQKCAFDELIDPSLGHQSDEEVRRMTTSIAELAFRCLQQDKEMRPSMYEVLEELQNIQRGDYKLQNLEQHGNNDGVQMEQPPPPSPECDEVSLLKNLKLVPPSPNSVTGKWISCDSTPNTSDQGLASLSM